MSAVKERMRDKKVYMNLFCTLSLTSGFALSICKREKIRFFMQIFSLTGNLPVPILHIHIWNGLPTRKCLEAYASAWRGL